MSSQTGTILPSPDVLNDLEYGKFVLSNLAAKRAKQLKDGAPPLVRIDSNHPLSIALAEIAAGKIKPQLKTDPDAVIEVIDSASLEDATGNELGILLPALDDAEAEILGVGSLVSDEHDEDHEDEVAASSISDLLEDGLAEPIVAEAEEGTVSLNQLAEEEGDGDDDETEV